MILDAASFSYVLSNIAHSMTRTLSIMNDMCFLFVFTFICYYLYFVIMFSLSPNLFKPKYPRLPHRPILTCLHLPTCKPLILVTLVPNMEVLLLVGHQAEWISIYHSITKLFKSRFTHHEHTFDSFIRINLKLLLLVWPWIQRFTRTPSAIRNCIYKY